MVKNGEFSMTESIKNSIFVEILRVILAAAYLVLFGLFTQNLYFDISCFVAAGLIIVLMIKPCFSKEPYIRRDSVKRGVILFVIMAAAYVTGNFILFEDYSKWINFSLTLIMTAYGVTIGVSYRPIMQEELLAEAPKDEE